MSFTRRLKVRLTTVRLTLSILCVVFSSSQPDSWFCTWAKDVGRQNLRGHDLYPKHYSPGVVLRMPSPKWRI